jgi:ABC-2 type transport system permease protein
MTIAIDTERTGPAPSPALLSDTWYLTSRKLRALARQPMVLAFSVIQPVGYQGSYLAFLIPGIVAMNAMSGNMRRACR